MIVLGCDQGLANYGFALLDFSDAEHFTVLKSGILHTKPDMPLSVRIWALSEKLDAIIEEYEPELIGCERLFFRSGKESQVFRSGTILLTSMVTGMLFFLAGKHKITILEFAPATVKKSITGDGKAQKAAMKTTIEAMCKRAEGALKNEHEADAIGIAITAAIQAQREKEK